MLGGVFLESIRGTLLHQAWVAGDQLSRSMKRCRDPLDFNTGSQLSLPLN